MLPWRVRLLHSENKGADTVTLPANPRKAKVLLAAILGFLDWLARLENPTSLRAEGGHEKGS